MSRVVTESRAYDSHFDSTYTSSNIPQQTMAQDPRISTRLSQPDIVAGSARYKYFRRPVMPRLSAVPPQVLLAPTATIDPAVPVEEKAEPATKDAEIQTIYRDSEAQTMPYTPDHTIPAGATPEILLLKDLHFENGGLSVGQKELEMIEFARMKRDVEANLPPFTDEASMNLRKRLMEAQEMREFKLREGEIDAKRENRIFVLQQALQEKNESAEFLASQRVESIRQARMEERETNLQKIRNKRIKVLRKLANRRNQQDPQLSSTEPKDIIDSYFNKASEVYAPIRRKGELNKIESEKFDVKSRTASMDVMQNILNLENKIPKKIKSATVELGGLNPMEPPKQLNETGYLLEKKGGRAAEPRMTSAAVRADRNKKRDIDEMARIIAKQKVNERGATRGTTGASSAPRSTTGGEGDDSSTLASPVTKITGSAGMSSPGRRGVKPRPASPDFTKSDKMGNKSENLSLTIACAILQKLIRGRAVQNMMYEGRYRRAELIAELRNADEMAKVNYGAADETVYTKQETNQEMPESVSEEAAVEPEKFVPTEDQRMNRERLLRESVLDAASGGAASNLVYSLVQEQERNDMIVHMHNMGLEHIEEKRKREAMEAGRRQREYMRPPVQSAADQDQMEGETMEELLPVALIRDSNRPDTPSEEDGIAKEILVEIVDKLMNTAVENVSRPTTAVEGADENVGEKIDENDEAAVAYNESKVSLLSGVAENSDVISGESTSEGMGNSESEGSLPSDMLANMSPNLMAALGVAEENIPTVETEWKPPEESGIDAAQKEGYSLAS